MHKSTNNIFVPTILDCEVDYLVHQTKKIFHFSEDTENSYLYISNVITVPKRHKEAVSKTNDQLPIQANKYRTKLETEGRRNIS